MNTDPSRNPPDNQQPDAGTPDAGQTAKQAASEPGPLGVGGDVVGSSDQSPERPERAEGAGGVMVSIESGHDPRLYSGFYAAPLKVFVGDRCVWDSELPTPAAWYEDSSLATWFPLTAETVSKQQDALDMDRDEFARIAVVSTSAEIQGICARAMQRIERTAPIIREHEELRKDYTALGADVLNCRQAIRSLLKFHPESAETGAELPPECWTPEYRRAVEYAKRCLSAGWAAAAGSGDVPSRHLEPPAPSDRTKPPEAK